MDDNALHQLSSTGNPATPEEYERKRAQIQAAKVFLERIESENEAGRAKYEAELLQKVREGDEARQRLLDLERQRNPTKNRTLSIEAAPSNARIEESPLTNLQAQDGQWTKGSAPSQASFQSTLRFGAPQSTTMPLPPPPPPPSYNGFAYQPPNREQYQFYPLTLSRHPHVPRTQNPAPHYPSTGARQGLQQPYYQPMPTPNQVDALQRLTSQYQIPSGTRRSSLSQTPVQSQSQTVGIHGSSSQAQANGAGNAYQNLQRVVYKPQAVQPVGTSSLTGALGPQKSQSIQPSAPPPLANSTSTSSPVLPEKVPKPPRVAHAPIAVSGKRSAESGPAVPQLGSDSEDRKSKILAFRSSILDWARLAQPNTYTEFFKIKVYKASNSALFITSFSQGKEVVEEQNAFFERLWVTAGLPPEIIPFKKVSTSGSSTSEAIAAGPPTPSTAPRPTATPTQSVSGQKTLGSQSASASTTLPTRISPQTPRQRTLIDPVSGTWRSPADADKRRLARDVISALRKRKQDAVQSSPDGNPAKRQALETPSTSAGVHRISEPVIPTSLTNLIPLPKLQVTTQPVEQQLQREMTSTPVAVAADTNSIQKPENLTEPSPQLIEPSPPPPPPIVTSLASLPSQSDSAFLQNNTSGPSNTKELHSFSTSSVSSLYDNTPGTLGQVAGQSESLPSEAMPTTSPTHTRAISSPVPGQSGPATPGVTSTILAPRPTTPPAKSEPFCPPSSSQVKPPPPSTSQVNRSEQNVASSSLNSIDESSGSVWPSGLDISQKASTCNAREPLFLPSPSPSPSSPSSLPSKKKQRSSSVYVLVPPPPEYLIRHRKRQSMKNESDSQKDSTGTSSVVSTSRTSRSLEDLSLPPESERDTVIEPHEQEAVQLSCSRLQPLSCRWGECGIILNSVDALIRHLNREHKPAGICFICRWTQCGRQCRSREMHLERHATMTLQCAYQGCKESYRTGSQLLKHFRAKHSNSMQKVQAKPFHYEFQPPVPLPNISLPSYLIVPTPVTPTTISPDQHSRFGPWVLRNIVGFDGDRPKRGQKSNGTTEESNSYEFLNMRSTRYSWNQSKPVKMDFADLDSEEISKECDQGLTFFGAEESGIDDIPPSDEERSLSPLFTNGDTETVDSERIDCANAGPSDEEDTIRKLLLE